MTISELRSNVKNHLSGKFLKAIFMYVAFAIFTIILIALVSMIGVLLAGVGISYLLAIIGNAIVSGVYGYSVGMFSINVIVLLIYVVLMLGAPCLIAPFVCVEFQNLMPLYMLKYDEIFAEKKANKNEKSSNNGNGEKEDDNKLSSELELTKVSSDIDKKEK